MNVRRAWSGVIERGCALFDTEEGVKLRKIQNTLLVVLFVSFCWAIIFEALLGLHMMFILGIGFAEIARLFIFYVPVTVASMAVTVACLSFQKERKMAKKTAELNPGLVAVKGKATAPADADGRQAEEAKTAPASAPLNFKVDRDFRRRFRRRAAEADLKLNELLRQALDAWEEKHRE